MLRKLVNFTVLGSLMLVLLACAPAAAPAPTPTKAPAAAPTTAPAAATTKAAEPTKPAAATSTVAPPTATPKPVTLQFGTIGVMADSGIWTGVGKGYFKEQGIDINVVPLPSSAAGLPMLGTEQLDFVVTSLSIQLLNAVDRGVDLRIIADAAQSRPNWEWIWYGLRKDLAGTVKSAKDLKDMKGGITSQGSLSDLSAQIMQEQEGLKPGYFESVITQAADQPAALANKALASAYMMEPVASRAIQQDIVTKWKPLSSLFGGKLQVAFVLAGPSLTKNKELSQRFMTAYLKGVRDYLKAFSTKEGRQDVVNALVKYSTAKEPSLYDMMEMPYMDPNGQLDRSSLAVQDKFFRDKGLYTGPKTFEDLIDLSAADAVVQKIGKQ